MKAKEEWVNKAMGSLDGAGRAELNPGIRKNILHGIREPGPGSREPGTIKDSVSYSLAWKIAAGILLLISLNVFTMVYYSKSSGNRQTTARSLATEYFSYMDHYNL